jgi:type IX secretion system PorP/SprF family membrane protein
MKKIVIALSFLGIFRAQAQDLHFSQTAQTPLLINPGAAGVYDGWERIIINHRNQWLGAGTQFMTTSIAADVNFFKNQRNDRAHLGLGVMFYNDIGGDANFGVQTGSVTLSGILPMGGNGHTLSAGIQGGFGSRKGDVTQLRFYSQFNNGVFDNNILSGEANSLSSFTYIDASTGVFYQFDGGKSTFARNNDMKFQLGASVYHVNQPQLKYSAGSGDKLYRKYVFMATYGQDIEGTRWAFDASALQFIQGPHLETIFGGMIRRRFEEGSKLTGFKQDASFGVGIGMRLKDAIIPRIAVDWKGFRLGASYDITISTLRRAYTGGSMEFSLSYTNLQHALFKRRRR